MKLLSLALAAVAFVVGDDEIRSLPGLKDELCFKHYAGYVPVAEDTKNLFYWFTESTIKPQEAPVLLWLNGGPGCSSLSGMFTELGPFVVDKDQSVSLNPYAWNKNANVLYMEQPAGVGFSFPAGPTGDEITASDTYDGLVQFFRLHPEFQGRPFYISGESYGGHYVPNLVKKIQDKNRALSLNDPDRINISGFAVGNAYTDWALDFKANVPYGMYHALTSPEAYDAALDACNGDVVPCFWPRPGYECTPECDAAVFNATNNAEDGSIDIYNIYSDVCLGDEVRVPNQGFVLEQERRKQINRMRSERKPDGTLSTTPISPIFATCAEDYATTYLNSPEVQMAINAKVGTKWHGCGLTGLYDFNFESVLPLYEQWVQDKDLDILVYNGDNDYILNFLGTENWIETLNLKVNQPWSRWLGSDEQVAGYFVDYDGMNFATVKGAGHMVPKDRPGHALDMINSFLAGTPLDKVTTKQYGPLCPN